MLCVPQALEDLQSVEVAFSDLHRRYEKSKSSVEAFKKVGQSLWYSLSGRYIYSSFKVEVSKQLASLQHYNSDEANNCGISKDCH